MAKKLYYKIGEACKELDIQPYVLRYWETEFQALSPSKSKSGQRVYSAEDLELIGRIKELLYKEGYTIAGAKKKLESEGAKRAESSDEAAGSPDEMEELSIVDAEEQEEAEPEAPTAKIAKKKAKTRTASSARSAKRKAAPRKAQSSGQEKTVARLRQGIEDALREAKEILEILDRS